MKKDCKYYVWLVICKGETFYEEIDLNGKPCVNTDGDDLLWVFQICP